jgi:hypothetical protein
LESHNLSPKEKLCEGNAGYRWVNGQT